MKLPECPNLISYRFVLKIKHTEDGFIEHSKARLIVQDFSQCLGWDYLESFALTICLAVIYAIFALIVAENFKYKSVDIITAYLNADLDETIYISYFLTSSNTLQRSRSFTVTSSR